MEGSIGSGMDAMDMTSLNRRCARRTERAASMISSPQDRRTASHAVGAAREGNAVDRNCRNRR